MHKTVLPTVLRRTASAVLLLVAAAAAAAPAAAQAIRGTVSVQGWGEAGRGAVVTLLDSTLTTLRTLAADDAGRFAFEAVPPGVYQLQAELDGAQSAVSALIRLDGDAEARIDLVLPSPMLNEAIECLRESNDSAGVLVGLAYEASSGLPLPRATVLLEWKGSEPGKREVRTDGRGQYRVCDAPPGEPLTARLSALGRVGTAAEGVVVEVGSITRQDVSLGAHGVSTTVTTVGVRRLESSSVALIEGLVTDAVTGAPLPDVAVRLTDAPSADATASGATGRFSLAAPSAGEHELTIEHLGYGGQNATLRVEAGSATRIEVRLAPRAVELEGIDVAGLSARTIEARAAPLGRRTIRGADLEAAIDRGQRVTDVVRDRFPLRVHEGMYVTIDEPLRPRRMICIQMRRSDRMGLMIGDSIVSLTDLPWPFCEMVAIIVDGVPMSHPGEWLRTLSLADFEHVEYLSPLDAGARWGQHASTNGALVLWTRGRSPWRM